MTDINPKALRETVLAAIHRGQDAQVKDALTQPYDTTKPESEYIADAILPLCSPSRDAVIEMCAQRVEGSQHVGDTIGPLFGVGWRSGITNAARSVRALKSPTTSTQEGDPT